MADAPPSAGDEATTAIETANQMSNEDFLNRYILPSADWPDWVHPRTGARHRLSLSSAASAGAAALQACLDLVHATSGRDYRASAGGWHAAAKRREMAAPELRYVLVRAAGDDAVRGFASVMPTFEHGQPVLYCYEIHLEPALQGSGLGRLLMGLVAAAAERMPTVRKVMLTCFVRNARARRFYASLGFGVDAGSPPERRLRGGRVVAPDYVILSRPTARAGGS